ncbi:MAG TPA: energy transducer TonB [Terriglobales bacterium]|nr:energy transducer TonB [Terriglobales bacterium]
MPAAIELPEPQVSGGLKVEEAVHVSQKLRVAESPRVSERLLFSDTLLDLGKSDRNRRRFATVFSFTLQCLLIAGLLIIPLMFTEDLPRQQLLTFLVAPLPPPPPPPPAAQVMAKVIRQIQSDLLTSGQLLTPRRIPERVQLIREEEAPPPLPSTGGVIGGVPGGVPGGQLGGVIGGIISKTSSLAAIPKLAVPAAPKRIRISQGVTKGLLIQKIEPEYPMLALQAHIQGQVVLRAIISKDGEIKELELVSGHPLLAPAAVEAVSHWRYRPFLLNGLPVEVETNVTVTFQLSQ